MAFQANVLRVIIASPSDVPEERRIVTEEIHRWNDANALARRLVLLPVKWETHSTPQLGEHPQSIINRQLLDNADIVVGIFGTRIGTPTEDHVSGTVEEIKKHVALGKTAKLYFSDVPVSPSSLNPTQYASLQQFREECQKTGLYATFNNLQEFGRDFGHHLSLELNQARYLWLTVAHAQPATGLPPLSPDALRLIKAAASSGDGVVILQETLGFVGLSAGNEEFTDGTSRSAAKWRAIVRELAGRDILESVSEGIYRLSGYGYEVADEEFANGEALAPTDVVLGFSGPPEAQRLEIKSSRTIHLRQLDFLTSTEACISTQQLSESGTEIEVALAYDKVMELVNSPRPDRSNFDHSGPAKLRLAFHIKDRSQEAILPVLLQPKFVNNTQWFTLAGSRTIQLQP